MSKLSEFGYAAGWRIAGWLPAGFGGTVFSLGADLAVRRDGGGVRQLRANLARVVPQADPVELDELTRRAMRSYARYWHETFRLPSMDQQEVSKKVAASITGVENLDAALAEGNGAVMALPHSGNWDVAGVWFVDYLGGPFMTVAERLKPESLYTRFLAYRESLGFRVVPLTGGPRPSTEVLREWLSDAGVACLLVDRNLGSGGVSVEFFGRTATMPGGAALLASQTGAALVPCVCQFTEGGWRLVFSPEIPVDGPGRLKDRVGTAMQSVADAFAESIGRQPEDWHMLGRIWSDAPADPPSGEPT
jgi:KDO2-lipid IV(A) lauroyltransferase